MQTLTEKLIQAGWAGRVLSLAQLARLLDGTPQRRYNLVNRALHHGELLQLRRGLYLLAPQLQNKPPHPFVLAQALQTGSYISFETALSFHGRIPESVPVTLSVVPGRRRLEVDHPALGLFRFYPLALRPGYFLEAVDRHTLNGQSALVAQPLRALLDIVCLRKLEALRLFEAYQTVQLASFSSLQADIAQGMADIHAGRVSAMDMAAIKAQGRALLKSKTGGA